MRSLKRIRSQIWHVMECRQLRYPHIHIGRAANLDEHAGRPIYYVFGNRSGKACGRILYLPRWQQWVATFGEGTTWTEECLSDLRKAIEHITANGGVL